MAAERSKLFPHTASMRPQSAPQQPPRLCIISGTHFQHIIHKSAHTTIRRQSLVIRLQYSYITYEPFRTQQWRSMAGPSIRCEWWQWQRLGQQLERCWQAIGKSSPYRITVQAYVWWGAASNYFYLLPAAMWRH